MVGQPEHLRLVPGHRLGHARPVVLPDVLAELLTPGAARLTAPAEPQKVASDTVADAQAVAARSFAQRFHDTREFVPEAEWHISAEESFSQMRVGSADRRVGDPDAHILRSERRLGKVDDLDAPACPNVRVAEAADLRHGYRLH